MVSKSWVAGVLSVVGVACAGASGDELAQPDVTDSRDEAEDSTGRGEPGYVTEVPGGFVYARRMHALTLAPGHELEFYEFSEREYGLREVMPIELGSELIMDKLAGRVRLAEAYKLALEISSDDGVPADLIEADRRLEAQAQHRAEQPRVDDPADEPLAQHLIEKGGVRPVVPPRGNNCSADIEGNGWSGQGFLSNNCDILPFRNCLANRFFEMTPDIRTQQLVWRQMEGDWNMIGHMHADRRDSTECEGSWIDPTCTEFNWVKAWDMDIQPRQIIGMAAEGGFETAQKSAWGWSLCNHMHFTELHR
jgi:hypothetical protein